jgi:hypothetical protein
VIPKRPAEGRRCVIKRLADRVSRAAGFHPQADNAAAGGRSPRSNENREIALRLLSRVFAQPIPLFASARSSTRRPRLGAGVAFRAPGPLGSAGETKGPGPRVGGLRSARNRKIAPGCYPIALRFVHVAGHGALIHELFMSNAARCAARGQQQRRHCRLP